MALREYQQQAVDDVLNAFQKHNRVMLQMPTGTGKTVVFCEIVNRQEKSKRKLILVHRKELVYQIRDKLLERCQIKASLIMAEHPDDYHPHYQVQIASIATLIRRPNYYPVNVSLIVIDEAHHAKAKTYQSIVEHYRSKNVKLLGVTATPCRLNGSGFTDSFDILIKSWSIKKFIDNGYLAGFKHWATSSPDLSKVKINKVTNDYDEHDLGIVMSEDKIMSDLIESYKKHGNEKQSIVFAVNKEHSEKIADRFRKEGYCAKSITCSTPPEERRAIIKQYTNGQLQILSNVAVFTEGFDCPSIAVVQIARPTKSLTLYLQMVGRALRPNPDSSNTVILDNAKLWRTHGLITRDHQWTLERVKVDGRDKIGETSNGEIVEREDEILKEVKWIELEQVDEIRPALITFTIHIEKSKQVIYREKLTTRFPDPDLKISKLLQQLKESCCFDTILIYSEALFIRKEIGLRKKWYEWKKDGFEYQLIQNGWVKNQYKITQEYASDINNSTVSLKYCCRELIFLTFIHYILVDPSCREMSNANSLNFFKGIKVSEKFYTILKSPFFYIDFEKLGIEFPYKEFKNIRSSVTKENFSFEYVLRKFKSISDVYYEIKNWLDIIG